MTSDREEAGEAMARVAATLRGIEITAVRANHAVLGDRPLLTANVAVQIAADMLARALPAPEVTIGGAEIRRALMAVPLRFTGELKNSEMLAILTAALQPGEVSR